MLTRLRHVDTIVSCDGADTVYRNCDLWFLDGVIARIGTWNQTPDREYDGTGMLVYPGLVNTHHHLYQYFTRNLASVQNYELFDWLKALYEIWKNLNADTVYFSSLCGMAVASFFVLPNLLSDRRDAAGQVVFSSLSDAEKADIRLHDLAVIRDPYVIIGIVVLAVLLVIALTE